MGLTWGRSAAPAADTASRRPAAESAARPGRLEAFEAAFTSAGIGFWIYDRASGELTVSEGLRDMHGKAFATAIRVATLPALLFGADAEDAELKRDWNDAWSGESLFDREHQIQRPDGATLWARSLVSVTHGPDGVADRVFGLMIDIDEQKRREAAYREAKEQAEAANRHKSDFLATMSHEIRTPLNGILGMAQVLATTDLKATQRSCIETIESSGKTLLGMLNDTLDLSKVEAGLLELHEQEFDLEALVRETVAGASGVAFQRGLTLEVSLAPDCAGTRVGDADRLRQLLSNLIFNGLKFTRQGSVAVLVEPAEGGLIRFSVRDTGPGIPPAELERIFERFRQAQGERNSGGPGTGLGLAISKNLVELMGGRIGLDSLMNVGSTFWFELPLPRPEAASEEKREATDAGGVAPVAAEDFGVRILIAEDDPTNQKVFRMAFDATDYEIEFANNGLEALQSLRARRFDLVLMDVNMPVMSGEEAIAQIRAENAAWRDLPIIVVTALTNRDSRRHHCEIGATDYLPKPIDVTLLLKKTANLLGEAAAARAGRL